MSGVGIQGLPDLPVFTSIPGLCHPAGFVDPAPKESVQAEGQSPGIHRPPTHPERKICGPYLQFLTTDVATKTWHGSALTLHRLGQQTPKLTFDHEIWDKATEDDVLYEDIYGYTAIRHNLSFSIPEGTGDEKIKWKLDGDNFNEEGSFFIARWDQAWRGAFFSCSGFDAYVPEGVVEDFTFENVWKHLLSLHETTPCHTMIWGGDQIYIDKIFDDVPFLVRWIKLEWDVKWKHEFSEDTAKYCGAYSFFSYLETWERPVVNATLRSSPALMTWDDHDIFDGAGSYPDELRTSPVMSGLFNTALRMRLLFQHHTKPSLSNTKHRYFGYKAQNHIAQCGPKLAILMPDGRSERTDKRVHDSRSEDMIFERLMGDAVAESTEHLITAFAVPFSFIRVPAAEAIFEFLKNRAPWIRKLPGIKGTNSIFDLPEFYDDLLDEWTHDKHIAERNDVLVRLQKFAATRSMRVTLLSGDVHCAGFSRFRSDKATRKANGLKPATDPKLMYQVIASAIVNASPSPNAVIGYHYVTNSWKPVPETEESTVPFFERRPEGGKQVRHRRFMPNRNWAYFEIVDDNSKSGQGATQYVLNDDDGTSSAQTAAVSNSTHHHHLSHRPRQSDMSLLETARLAYPFDKKGYPSTLGPTSTPAGTGMQGKPNHEHHHGPFCHHKRGKGVGETKEMKKEEHEMNKLGLSDAAGLRVRIWLESRKKEAEGRQFSSYELVIPELVTPARLNKTSGKVTG